MGACQLAKIMSEGDTAKPGLWTLDWTMDWTMDWTGNDHYQFSEAKNSVLKVG